MERIALKALVRATGCAEERGELLFLRDPRLGVKIAIPEGPAQVAGEPGWLCVATGGTSGGMKFARHDEGTLTAAVRGFGEYFGLAQVNAVDVLPAYHVSGLMARVRCAETGGEHVAWEWKRLEAGERPGLRKGREWVLSLVPTQLQRLLATPAAVAWLRGFKIIFVGGGPVWPELAEMATRAGLPVALSYGMTETAAMVTALRPEEFLSGGRSCGAALPHVRVKVNDEGVVCVEGESVFRGYFGAETVSGSPAKCNLLGYTLDLGREDGGREVVTEDLGRIDARGHLHLLGRRDAVIITGGKKVQPAVVEAVLRASGEFDDVAVIGVPDREWGQAVAACYVKGSGRPPDLARASARLAPHERPKRFVEIAESAWPRTGAGKVNRAELARLAARKT